MNLPAESEQRSRVAEFQRKHRVGLVTLLFTDIVGSTKLKQERGDHEAVMLIQQHHQVVREILGQFREGQEISTSGDSFFIVFAKPSDAVRFSLQLQARLRALGQQREYAITDRIGIHVGEVFVEQSEHSADTVDLYGIQVDSSARVMSLAQGNQILMTRFAFDNARQVLRGQDIAGVGQLSWLNHGLYVMKGVEEPLEICEVGEAGLAPLAPPPNSEKAARQVSGEDDPVLGWRPAVDEVVPNTKWILKEKLGEGGFGEVWLGMHEMLKKQRVFKFCFHADRVRSLKREVALFRVLMEKSGDHPNIVGVEDICFDEPPYYIVMSYAEGKDLAAWAKKQGGLDHIPLAERLEVVAQVADGLEAAHQAGVIHRDIKPSNILITADKSDHDRPLVKLTDFGIGQAVSEDVLKGLTLEGIPQTMIAPNSYTQSGTYLYMPPELIGGKAATTKSDIYSLGVVLYQMIVGDLTRALGAEWPDEISCPVLRGDLKRCFSRNPEDRFSAGDLSLVLRSYEERKAAFDSDQTTFITRDPEAPTSAVFLKRTGAAAARFEPFKFSNGAMARHLGEFKELCRSNLAEAAARLRDGSVENWLRHCEEEAEAARAQQIRETAGEDWEAALEEFLTGTRPFIFRTGESATTLDDWFAYAQKNPKEGQFQLYTDVFDCWLRFRGWADWADTAAGIRTDQPDHTAGFTSFMQMRGTALARAAQDEQYRLELEQVKKRFPGRRAVLIAQVILVTLIGLALGWGGQQLLGLSPVLIHPSPFQLASPLASVVGGGFALLLICMSRWLHGATWAGRRKKSGIPLVKKSDADASAIAHEFTRTWKRETRKTFYPLSVFALLLLPAGFLANDRYGQIARVTLEQARVAGLADVQPGLEHHTNSLGMVLVKLPGTVTLFSIWETRCSDYAAFAKAETDAAEMPEDGGRELVDDMPITNVKWTAAQAFCQWLTRTEQAEGKLPPGLTYRLPTDLEWSLAAGLPTEKGKTPKLRSGQIAGVYPWGETWPPPIGSGNLSDSYAFNGGDGGIPGYYDGYAFLSPFGSYAPNPLGIYDLEGNVSEWCDDWFDTDKKERVMRGGNMWEDEAEKLLSSARSSSEPDSSEATIGFRVVLGKATENVSPH